MRSHWAGNNKLRGYTLLETVITMAIATILVTITFSALFIVRKDWTKYSDTQKALTLLLNFRKLLKNDIDNSAYIVAPYDKTLCLVSEDTVNYHFSDNIIRKTNGRFDTIPISVSAVNVRYVTIAKDQSLVKEVTLNITSPLKLERVIFNKYYTATDLMTANTPTR